MHQNSNIESIIENAFNNLSKELTQACISRNYFVTYIQSNNLKKQVIIDTRKNIIFNEEKFVEHSLYLFNLFSNVKKWYNC